MSNALHVKLFNQFKTITDDARSAVSRIIQPLLNGVRMSGTHDKALADLYTEWQACCRAAAGALAHAIYPNELLPMPTLPIDDDEHAPCRQMAAVIIERTIYDEFTAERWFHAAAENIKNHPNCANHSKSCPCQTGLDGWTYPDILEKVKQLDDFYKAHYNEENDPEYVAEVRAVANVRGVSFENELARRRRQKADLERDEEIQVAKKAAKAEKLKDCVFICYQDVHDKYTKYNNGNIMHGWFRVVKTATHHEFTIMDTGGMHHPDWHNAVANKQVWRFPLDVIMGVKDDTFENVTPDKIHNA
jgi:hypothetical protein